MAMLTQSRNVPELADAGRIRIYPVEANTTIYLGAAVALNRNGNAVPAGAYGATPNDKLVVVGRAELMYLGMPGQNAVNTAAVLIPGTNLAAGAAGAISIAVRKGVFMMGADASIAQAQVGELAFQADDNTVSAGASVAAAVVAVGATPAGTVIEFAGRRIVRGTVVVTTDPAATTYQEGRDYIVMYDAGALVLPVGTTITASANMLVSYRHSNGMPAAGRIVEMDPAGTGEVFIDYWNQSAVAA